ncbi:uncharacterized protein LOC124132404 [Haliotis rufescens]|uniref:uncharacterized protein LOC124132404 n=1 Tax=Haliotis rufescens TaxID=6454 RepID=UPI00201E95B0|nr:uncharacterized protein LOC124132404 [Haliotis rufescens]
MALFSNEKLKYLRTLGLKFDATEDDIKKTYKKLALIHHPDKCQNDPEATKRFQELSAAYYGLQRLKERERRAASCNCGHAHYDCGYDLDLDYSDYYDSDDEYSQFYSQDDEDELLDFFRKIFMDVFSEFVFKKKFQSKRKKPDPYTTEDTEEEGFFEFLSTKFRSEGRSSIDDYILTEDDLKKFQSYDEWQKARDPSKPPNRCKRRAVQKSRRRQKEEQKQMNKKQRKTEQKRKEKELQAIRDQLLRTLDEKKEKKKKRQDSETPHHKPSSEPVHLMSRATKSPERLEIERQLTEAQRKEHELQENLRRLEAQEHKQEKKLRKLEKKKAKKQQNTTQSAPSLPSEQRNFPHQTFNNTDFMASKYDQKNLTSSFDHKRMSKEERDKGLADLMDQVRRKQRSSEDGGSDVTGKMSDAADAVYAGQERKTSVTARQNDTPTSASTCTTPTSGIMAATSLLDQHLEAYHELMKLQPRRHTEQQLREERLRIRDAQLRSHQSELERLRRKPSNDLSQDDLYMKRDELLRKQREKERLRNEEEAFELKKEVERQRSAPSAPVSRKYYESISYHEKQHSKMEPHTPHRQTPRRTSRTPPLITTFDNPIKREIPNRQSTWSRVVTSETPWGERTRKQIELKTMLPSNMDEEEEMLQQALSLSMQTAELDMQQRKWQEQLEQAEVDRQIMAAANRTTPNQQTGTRNRSSHQVEPTVCSPIAKYPLSDKFLVYPGPSVNQSASSLAEFEARPSWSLPPKPKSETRKVCRPKPASRDTWSLCPGRPSDDDWSCSKSAKMEGVESELEEYDNAVEEGHFQLKSLVKNGHACEPTSLSYETSCMQNNPWTNTQHHGVNRNVNSSHKAGHEKKSLGQVMNKPLLNTNDNSNNFNSNTQKHLKARDSSSHQETTDDWDAECRWKTEGPSYPLRKYKPKPDSGKSLSGKRVNENLLPPKPLSLMLGNRVPCSAEIQVQTDQQTPKTIPGFLGNPLPCTAEVTVQTEDQQTPVTIPAFLRNPLPCTAEVPVQTDGQLQTEAVGVHSITIEAETNTEPLVEPDLVPERHDCFTQTKVSSGFVGGVWDSASNNADKIPVPRPQTNSLPDQEVLKKIPPNGFSHSHVSNFRGQTSNRVPQMAPEDMGKQPQRQKPEDWDDNLLVSSFAEVSVKNHAAKRTENSITVNTNHENTMIPRLPVITPVLNDSPQQNQVTERMMTDDQKLSDHHYNVQQAEQTTQPSGRNVSGCVTSEQSSLPGGLPIGLPQHLIQAYLQFVTQNETQPIHQQASPHPGPEKCVQDVASHKASSEMTSNPPCSATSATYALPGSPGFMSPMWSHLYPWMGPLMANPVMSHPMMPFCPPPVFAYSLQQQMKPQEPDAKEVTSSQRSHQGIAQRSCVSQEQVHGSPHRWNSGFGQQDPVSLNKSSSHESEICKGSEGSRLDTEVENCTAQQTCSGFGQKEPTNSVCVGQQEPMNKGGFGQNEPMNKGGFGQKEPMNKGGFGQKEPMNKGGFGQKEPMNKGGFGQKEPMNKGGFGQKEPMNKGGFGQEGPMNKGGFGQNEPMNKGSFGQQEPMNKGSFGQNEPMNKGQAQGFWMQQNQPGSEGNMNNSNLVDGEMGDTLTQSDGPYSSRNMRSNIPPRFQRQKRLELNKKIKTLIQEINKEQEDYKETEIVTEEDRISA